MAFALDYEQSIHLDAEELAEGGIGEAYERLLPDLRKYVSTPACVIDLMDDVTPRYSVKCGNTEYPIHGPDTDGGTSNSWGRATVVLFALINDQLASTAYRFYAINSGNDLFGLFLTPSQAMEARAGLPDLRDWPYRPTAEPPWYGQHH